MKVTGVIHIHSTHSYDGKLSLPQLKDFRVERGVQFACMTEHTDQLTKEKADRFVAECRALSDDEFIFVPGFEVPYKDAHILHIGAAEFICDFANSAQLQLWRKVSPLVILAHPIRNKFKVDVTIETVVDGVEVWNQQYEGKTVPRTKSVQLLNQLREVRPSLIATGGLDFHRQEHFGSPLTYLEVTDLAEENIIKALKSGTYEFGYDECLVEAKVLWQPTVRQKLVSYSSVVLIGLGKWVNKWLANIGLSLPKSLKQAIRSRV